MKKVILPIVAILLVGSGFWYYNRDAGEPVSPYRFVQVERGNLEEVVSSTGTLDAVTTVEVGTQVSGLVTRILVDYNDTVRKGQVIALIDTTVLVSSVHNAEAELERSQAQLDHAAREFDRLKQLYDRKIATEVEFNQARYEHDIANSSTKSARLNLERAQQNLQYATIYAPISGVVIERNVDVGQTVAASFSAPILFLIANDLTRMQILASVDESDIGRIEEGQNARFMVQAYPDEFFEGTVRQVRLQSVVEENIVNYTVVIDVQNEERKLLPGMTATVDFLIKEATDILKVPNAALRFRPTESMLAELRARREERMASLPDSVRENTEARAARFQGNAEGANRGDDAQGGGFPGGGAQGGGFGGGNRTMLWYLDADGRLNATPVRTGITDGQSTEIMGRDLEAGLQVITGVTSAAEESEISSPFQQNQDNNPGARFRGF